LDSLGEWPTLAFSGRAFLTSEVVNAEGRPPIRTMIRASSERLHTSPQHGGPLRTTLSSVSLASSSGLFTETLMSRRSGRSFSSSPPPKSQGHGRNNSPRRFSSRHVPSAAEDLAAQSKALTPIVVSRFDGLMKHLKRNTERQDFEKQVLASPPEVLIPDEYDEVLRGEFARRCSFGERLNTELMHSGKWAKMLRDLGLIRLSNSDRHRGPCLSSMAEADIIFRRVLHDSDYGGKRLTYDYFAKALCLVAANVYPDLGWEDGMSELLARIAAQAEEAQANSPQHEPVDFSLDPNVLLVLDHFKLALQDLFRSFARRQLPGPTDARVGAGTTRLRERSIWKHTQDTIFATRNSTFSGYKDGLDGGSEGYDTFRQPQGQGMTSFEQDQEDSSILPAVQEGVESERSESFSPPQRRPEALGNAEADAGGGYAEASPRRNRSLPAGALQGGIHGNGASPGGSPGGQHQQPVLEWATNRGWCSPGRTGGSVASGSRQGTWAPSSTQNDPYSYANGSPMIKHRKSFMSLEQMLSLCKELKIVPDLLSRQALVKIFKRVQCAGSASQHGGSNFGYLSQEAFVDAMGQIAVEAYTQEPYCDEFPAAHEKIHAFMMVKLPCNNRAMRDRFFYGCQGRGPPVNVQLVGPGTSASQGRH